MARVMRTYAERWRFKHPATDDFLAVLNEVSGRDFRRSWRRCIDRGELVDYEVGSIASVPARAEAGYFDTPQHGHTLVTQDDADAKAAREGTRRFDTVVMLRRRGNAIWPVDVRVQVRGEASRACGVGRAGALAALRVSSARETGMGRYRSGTASRIGCGLAEECRAPAARSPRRRALTSRWLLVVQQMLTWVGM